MGILSLRTLERYFLQSHVFLTFCTYAAWMSTRQMSDLPAVCTPELLLVLCATLGYYEFHKYSYTLPAYRPRDLFRFLFYSRIWWFDRICILVSLMFAAVAVFYVSVSALMLVLLTACLSVFYTVPILRRKGRWIRLREIPSLKMGVIATGWTISTVLLPLWGNGNAVSFEILLLACLSRWAIIYGLCIPFEIRDEKREARLGNRPILEFGRKRVLLRGTILVLAPAIIAGICARQGLIHEEVLISLVLAHVITVFWIWTAKPQWPRWIFKFGVDGTIAVPYLFLTLV